MDSWTPYNPDGKYKAHSGIELYYAVMGYFRQSLIFISAT